MIEKNFGGCPDLLVAALIDRKKLSKKQMDALWDALNSMENQK